MKTYEITLKHDAGTVKARATASSYQAAIELVCLAEKAPTSAVQTWRIIPTAKQIARTKSLMRGL